MKKFENLTAGKYFYDYEQYRTSLLSTDISDIVKNYQLIIQNKIEGELLEFLSYAFQRSGSDITNFIGSFNNIKLKHLKCIAKDSTYSYFYKERPVLLVDYPAGDRDTVIIDPVWKKEGGREYDPN